MTFILSVLIIYFILFPKNSMSSIISGTELFFYSVFPTIFPFLTIIGLLIEYNGINIYANLFGSLIAKPLRLSKNSSFAIIASFLCGYPFGTKYAENLYRNSLIDKNEFLRLLNIASNASPLFLVGTVGLSMLNNKKYGYILLLGNYISCIIMSFLIFKKESSNKNNIKNITYNKKYVQFGEVFTNALQDSMKTCINIACFIIIFSMFIAILSSNNQINTLLDKFPIIKSILFGSLEITNGIKLISLISNISINLKLSLISLLCSFGGLCILFQTYSFVSKYKEFNLYKYLSLKIVQSIISFTITYIFSYIIL